MNCETVNFVTALLSSNPEILEALKIGDLLQVTRGEFSVVVKTAGEEKVGSIVAHATQLLACMESGHSFIAEVKEILDGVCRVQVTHAP